MLRAPRRLTLALLLLAPLAVRPARGDDAARPYTLTIASDLQIKAQDQPKPEDLHAMTTLDYALAVQGQTREVTIQAVAVRAQIGDKDLSDSRMDRRGVSIKVGEQPVSDVSYEQAPDPLKAVLDDFDRPAASYTLDAEGGEASQKLLIKPDSSLVENGLIALTRLFHVRFPKDEDRWESPASVSLSSGQFARGPLTYEKAGADADGRVTVKVSGTLKAEGKLGAGEIRNGVYKVSGTQIYDPTLHEWVSGDLALDVTFDLATPGEPLTSANGTMKVSLRPNSNPDARTATPAK